jgi:hypothetical protein
MMDEVDFAQLTELTELRFGLTRSPRVIDLTRNQKLIYIDFSGLQNTEVINIAHHNKISGLSISGCKLLGTSSLNSIIDDIHYSAVTDSRHEGFLHLGEEWWETDEMLGPPSVASMAKLRSLRDNYAWEIYPEFE